MTHQIEIFPSPCLLRAPRRLFGTLELRQSVLEKYTILSIFTGTQRSNTVLDMYEKRFSVFEY